jgi:hypothetical protein
MPPEPIPTEPELNALAAALAGLAPARTRIDRDRLMFQAGQASAQASIGGGRPWIALAATLGLVAVGEAVLLARRPAPRATARLVAAAPPSTSPTPSPPPPPPRRPFEPSLALGQTAYERRVGQILRYGLDGLPAGPTFGDPDAAPERVPSRQLLREEVQRILDPGDAS